MRRWDTRAAERDSGAWGAIGGMAPAIAGALAQVVLRLRDPPTHETAEGAFSGQRLFSEEPDAPVVSDRPVSSRAGPGLPARAAEGPGCRRGGDSPPAPPGRVR